MSEMSYPKGQGDIERRVYTQAANPVNAHNMATQRIGHDPELKQKQVLVGERVKGGVSGRECDNETDKRRNHETGTGIGCNAGGQQQESGFRIFKEEREFARRPALATLSDDQEEKVREFKKSVRHFKHQLECNYATQTHTLQQTLGHGGFGAVYLVKRKTDGHYFALKQVPKRKVLKASSRERQFAERNFLSACKSPSVVQLHVTFQDELFLYQVVEFLQGGSMMHYMHAKQKFPEDVVKLCIAELVLAVKEVHEKNYIHRDIKPDNIVFTRDGHLKLLDFGLAKFAPYVFQFAAYARKPDSALCGTSNEEGETPAPAATMSTAGSPLRLVPTYGSSNQVSPDRLAQAKHLPHASVSPNAFEEGCCRCLHMQDEEEISGDGQLNRPSDTLLRSICGTPMYTAPEVLRGEGYDHSVDWWSVGVVMFEMLYGGIPFCPPPKYRGDVATFVKVQVTNHALVCPIPYPSPVSSVISSESISLMQSLVCEPEHRFKSAAKIMQHPWFDGIEWETLHQLKSPLCEDTELYARRHFPLIDAAACADSLTEEDRSAGSGKAPKATESGGQQRGRAGKPADAVERKINAAQAEPDLFFARYEFSRRAVETLPTFAKVLQRNAGKHSPSGGDESAGELSRSSGEELLESHEGAKGADSLQGLPSPAGLAFSPDPKRCELAAREDNQGPQADGSEEGSRDCEAGLLALYQGTKNRDAREDATKRDKVLQLSFDELEERLGVASSSTKSERGEDREKGAESLQCVSTAPADDESDDTRQDEETQTRHKATQVACD
ncbi:AGC kinase [Besnoitia besnoiti]|uniref:non-specific serine/threonine protein kinase n=1 Tax=Besnoitia besnoiti TaxID=94643 RepID=A0A2A9MNP9_BESBE|nr:AGC kinase [Besnoitia besnoiti]PFH37350.1 AGC kinase [Besnoitia besnoiti]